MERLRRNRDFQALMSGRRSFRGRLLIAFARPNDLGRWRLGVAMSRGIKGSVRRNRARRRLREGARLVLGAGSAAPVGIDVVLLAREGALVARWDELIAEISAARERLLGP